jgi:hypothetical protein
MTGQLAEKSVAITTLSLAINHWHMNALIFLHIHKIHFQKIYHHNNKLNGMLPFPNRVSNKLRAYLNITYFEDYYCIISMRYYCIIWQLLCPIVGNYKFWEMSIVFWVARTHPHSKDKIDRCIISCDFSLFIGKVVKKCYTLENLLETPLYSM